MTRPSLLLVVATISAMLATSSSSSATTFAFEYRFTSPLGGGILSGTLEGTLQPDGDTILVADLLSASYTLAPLAAFFLPNLGGLQASLSGAGITHLATLQQAS